MEYLKLFWRHGLENEPVVILYEVNADGERLALRSIDIYAGGNTKNVGDLYAQAVEITSIPTVEELNSHVWGDEFYACLITKEEFEKIWNGCFYDGTPR